MSGKRVLIVGAGALGITCAYHLQLAGAEISFLVRPHRKERLSRPQRLYCYNDHSLRTLQNYQVFTAVEELRGLHVDFVLLTLDGATCRSEQGIASLTELGQALANTGASLIICGVGVALFDHVQTVTGFAKANMTEGTMRMAAYQVAAAQMPLPPPTNIDLHNSADIAYLFFPDRVGFFITSNPKRIAKMFSAVWDQCGELRCKRMPNKFYTMLCNSFFPFTTASELNHWQGTDALIADKALWQLCCDAQREIMALKQHGLSGWLFSKLMNNARLEKMMRDMDDGAKPMGFTAFNRFHHGGKVEQQDIQIMSGCVAAGEAEGRSMTAVKTLLAKWHERKHQSMTSHCGVSGLFSAYHRHESSVGIAVRITGECDGM